MAVLLKPDRTIVEPGSPGWDDALPDRPRARHSDWWRRLTAGRGFLSRRRCCCTGGTGGQPCHGCTVPNTLHITDDYTTVAVTFSLISSSYVGCYWMMPGGSIVTPCDCLGGTAPSGSQTLIDYHIQLIGTTTCVLSVVRNWYWCFESGRGCFYCQDVVDLPTCDRGPTSCSGINRSCNAVSDSGTQTLTGCTFPLSMTLGLGMATNCDGFSGTLSSPLSGNITIQT